MLVALRYQPLPLRCACRNPPRGVAAMPGHRCRGHEVMACASIRYPAFTASLFRARCPLFPGFFRWSPSRPSSRSPRMALLPPITATSISAPASAPRSAQIVAEELDVSLRACRVVLGDSQRSAQPGPHHRQRHHPDHRPCRCGSAAAQARPSIGARRRRQLGLPPTSRSAIEDGLMRAPATNRDRQLRRTDRGRAASS